MASPKTHGNFIDRSGEDTSAKSSADAGSVTSQHGEEPGAEAKRIPMKPPATGNVDRVAEE